MKKRSTLTLVLATFVLVGLLAPAAVAGGVFPYFDDFNDGSSADWNVIRGDWVVVDGEYQQTNTTPCAPNFADCDMISEARWGPTDMYGVQVDARLIEPGPYNWGWWGLVFRYQDLSNYELASLWYNLGETGIDYWTYSDAVWVLRESVTLDSGGPSYSLESHRLGLGVEGVDLSFYVDGALVMEAVDQTGFSGGTVGLYTYLARTAFDEWSFDWLRPSDAIRDLIVQVEDLGLNSGMTNSLTAKLSGAAEKLDDGNPSNDVAAIGKLGAFVNQVEAQSGEKIPAEAAQQLIGAANRIVGLLAI